MSPRLELADVCVGFGGVRAVDSLSISVAAGQIRGLIGPNGAGKTTVINAITGVVPILGGEIRLDGQRISGMPAHVISRMGVGRTFQHVEAFGELTVLENVLIGAGRASHAGLLSYALSLPSARASEASVRRHAMASLEAFDLLAVRNERTSNLPFGLLKRMDLARSMVASPKLLLMDEPTSGMSESEADSAIAAARELAQMHGTTLLVVEHNMRVMMSLAQHISVMQFGSLIAEGSPAEIQASPMVIDAYLGERVPDAVH
jgi:branched-chain amino acid transport system ATP-binding protein